VTHSAQGTAQPVARHITIEQGGNADALLVERAKTGDLAAFRALFERYQRAIYNLAYRMVTDPEDAADITQESFVRAYRSLPRLKHGAAFSSWLRKIATNLCRDHVKRPSIPTSSLEADEAEQGAREIADSTQDTAGALLQRELHGQIQAALASLSPEHRMVVTLHHLQGVTVEEIAKIMSCSVGTVKSRLARAREALKRRLQSYIEV